MVEENENIKENILSRFLLAVKSCQVKYGGRTELATETDVEVATLCQCLEETLTHKLKLRPLPRGIGAIRQVTDLVQTGLNHLSLGNDFDGPVLWCCVRELLPRHEMQRFLLLREVTTDEGRGRAWIRSLLNEHSLERYIHIMVSDQPFLELWYEPNALMRDHERAAMLPNLAAGLDSILFAIAIDKGSLNGCSKPPPPEPTKVLMESLEDFVLEPKVAVTPPDVRNTDLLSGLGSPSGRRRRRRKAPSQLVTPQGSQYLTSDRFISPAEHSNLNNNPSSEGQESKCKMSSGEEDNLVAVAKSASDVSDQKSELSHLTPLTSGYPGGLLPIGGERGIGDDASLRSSSQSQDDFDVSDSSSDAKSDLKIMSSLSSDDLRTAVLEVASCRAELQRRVRHLTSALEERSRVADEEAAEAAEREQQLRQRVQALEAKITTVTRENELLRHQLKKYIGAVQMLRGGEEDALGGLVSPSESEGERPKQHRDYHGEAAAFEQKLIQVAEMHGELIEFNERLQQTLKEKDMQIIQLRSQLIELRGPLPSLPEEPVVSDAPKLAIQQQQLAAAALINIWIPTAFLAGGNSKDTHHVYQIYVRIHDDEWNVYRRFAQFFDLFKRLKKRQPRAASLPFPQKKTFGYKDMTVVEDRRVRLQKFLRELVNLLVSTEPQLATPSKEALVAFVPFLGDKESSTTPSSTKKSIFSRISNRGEAAQQNSPHYNGL